MPYVEKRCFKCDEQKPVSAFYRNRSRSDGYADNCRECQAEYRKLMEEKAPGAIRAYNRAYYQANRDKLVAKHRQYMRARGSEALRAKRAELEKDAGVTYESLRLAPTVA